jgi:3-oxoadipate enol-lactonase
VTRPALVLSSSLGTTRRMWDPNVAGLSRRYDLIRYEHPGHGDAPPGPRTIEGLAQAALAVAPERFAFCGLSLGGMVGMWLAAHTPHRVERLVLACTAPILPPREQWLERARTVRKRGVEAIADAVVDRWFTDSFEDTGPWRDLLASTPREGYARCCEAIGAMDLRPELARIEAPTTVILGREDPVVGEDARSLLAQVGEVVELEAAHLANVERPDDFNEAVLSG